MANSWRLFEQEHPREQAIHLWPTLFPRARLSWAEDEQGPLQMSAVIIVALTTNNVHSVMTTWWLTG